MFSLFVIVRESKLYLLFDSNFLKQLRKGGHLMKAKVAVAMVGLLAAGLVFPLVASSQEAVPLNPVIQPMEEGKPALGVFSLDFSLNNAAQLADSDLDFMSDLEELFP